VASNFAFRPYGLSQSMTVGGAAPATISLIVQGVGSTVTQQIQGATSTTNIVPTAVRVSNDGTAACFINFGNTAGTVSVSTTNGLKIRNGSDVVLMPSGQPFLAGVCAGTFTVTLSITPGEGMT
jgi:hypothetical protein